MNITDDKEDKDGIAYQVQWELLVKFAYYPLATITNMLCINFENIIMTAL